MSKETAAAAAEKYATDWGVPWGDVVTIEAYRPWWTLFTVAEYVLAFHSTHGSGEVNISASFRITRFEFYPNDLVPLWAAYPGLNSVTINWRMAHPEIYKYRWHDWYRGLSDEQRSEYKLRFPPPTDEELCWQGFYEQIAEIPAKPDSPVDFILGRVPV